MIRAEGLSVTGRLSRIEAELQPGRLHVLVGPNGAGKSTLLGALAGSVRPSSGAVWLDDRRLDQWDPGALARRRAAVGQEALAPLGLSVAEVVALGRSPHGDHAISAITATITSTIEAVGLTPLGARRMGSLSGGERQRAQLARALVQVHGVPAPLILLDEPTAAADLGWQERVFRLLRARVESGATVIVVVHDLNLAARHADVVWLLHRGRLLDAGPPDRVLRADLLSPVWGLPFAELRHAGRPVLIPMLECP